MFYEITTKNQEKYFKTDIVASFVEVCYLGGFEYEKIFEFASFVVGEEVNMSNISYYRNTIMNILKEQYPFLKRNLYLENGESLNEDYIKNYKKWYRDNYGKYMLVKSVKKEYVKQLKLNKRNTIK